MSIWCQINSFLLIMTISLEKWNKGYLIDLSADIKKMNNNWKGLFKTELNEEWWWIAYALPQGVTEVSK